MRLLPFAVFAVAALAAAPVAAQVTAPPREPAPSGPPPFVGRAGPENPGSRAEMRHAREQIADGREAGQLSRREARGLRRQTRYVDGLADRYGSDGLSDAEARELEVRARVLRDETLARRSGARRP